MLVRRTVRIPESLEAAKDLVRQQVIRNGYQVVAIQAYWQPRLFDDAMDAFVEVVVRKGTDGTNMV